MDKKAIQSWAEGFVADLSVGGERVPLDRVIAAHLSQLRALRASGLTWRGIAAIIARAGGRRANGKEISSDQLRADVSRLGKRQAAALLPVSSEAGPVAVSQTARARGAIPPARSRPLTAPLPRTTFFPSAATRSDDPKEVSNTDIAAALARLKLPS